MTEVYIFQEGSIYFRYISTIGQYTFEVFRPGELNGGTQIYHGRLFLPGHQKKIISNFYPKYANFRPSRMNVCQHYVKL